MIAKFAVAGALSFVLLPLPDSEFPPTIPVTHPYVEKLTCLYGSGTGFKLKDGRWVSANHVTAIGGCMMDGKPITVIYADREADISVFVVDDNRRGGMEIDCGGFADREWYWGIGHGRGLPLPQIVSGRYSSLLTMLSGGRFSILEGNRYVPGMSGGPVTDKTGRVRGIVNALDLVQRLSYSRPLQRTVLCS